MSLRTRFSLVVLAILGVALAGCDQKAMLERFTPTAEDQLAREFIDAVLQSKIDAALPLVVAQLQEPASRKGFDELVKVFGGGERKDLKVIGLAYSSSHNLGRSVRTVRLTYQLQLTTGWFTGIVVMVDDGSGPKVSTARFNPIADSLETLNRFTLHEKGVLHYLFLLGGIAVPLFSLVTLVICARSPIRRKWLWIIFILVGFVSFRLNWTTGEFGYRVVSFVLFGASSLRSGLYGPWIISIAIPVGAIVFLAKRRELIAQKAAGQPVGQPPPLQS